MISRQGFFALAVFSAVSFLAAAHAGAADNVWTPVGPPGGIVTGLAFDGGTADLAYAATTGGFFRSTDGGASWAASNGGLRDAHLQRLVTMGAAIYVGGTDGVSRSDDRGLQFRRLASAPTSVTALAIGVGANPPLFAAGIFSGAWRSDDGGATWKEINEGLESGQTLPAATVNAFLVHPRRAGLLWAGAQNGVYRSLDGGAHWARTSAGLACGLVSSLAIDSKSTLYAGCYVDPIDPLPTPPLFVSFDLGLTWHAAVHGLAARGVTALLADPAGAVWAGTEDAGVFRTVNGGRRWIPAGTGTEGQAIGALAQAPRQPSLLLAGGGIFFDTAIPREGPGTFRTTSGGARWIVSTQHGSPPWWRTPRSAPNSPPSTGTQASSERAPGAPTGEP
jgi:ligand-binding sensor domain-containing protein